MAESVPGSGLAGRLLFTLWDALAAPQFSVNAEEGRLGSTRGRRAFK